MRLVFYNILPLIIFSFCYQSSSCCLLDKRAQSCQSCEGPCPGSACEASGRGEFEPHSVGPEAVALQPAQEDGDGPCWAWRPCECLTSHIIPSQCGPSPCPHSWAGHLAASQNISEPQFLKSVKWVDNGSYLGEDEI